MGKSGYPAGTQAIDYNPTANTWSYTAPSWDYVSLAVDHAMGVSSTVTLKRGTFSTWGSVRKMRIYNAKKYTGFYAY